MGPPTSHRGRILITFAAFALPCVVLIVFGLWRHATRDMEPKPGAPRHPDEPAWTQDGEQERAAPGEYT